MLNLRHFISPKQLSMIGSLCRGEEGEHFRSKLVELAAIVAAMPATYQGREFETGPVAHLHYFTASADFYIVEKDSGSATDAPGTGQIQAYGLADIYHDGGEIGYISLPEIFAAGAEIDLYWQPKTIAEIRSERSTVTA